MKIIKYYYRVGESGNYTPSESNKYTFTELQPGTKYKLFIYVEDDKGNTSSHAFYYEVSTENLTGGDYYISKFKK